MVSSPSMFSVHGISQARILKWLPFPVVLVQSLSYVWLFVTPWITTVQASLSFTVTQSLLKLIFIESGMPSYHLILCCPLLLLPSVFPSIRVFSSESALLIKWPKYCTFNFSPSNEFSELISFRIDRFDLLAVQGTLKSSPALQFKGINFLVLSNFYHPALTSVHVIFYSRGTSQPCIGKRVLYH